MVIDESTLFWSQSNPVAQIAASALAHYAIELTSSHEGMEGWRIYTLEKRKKKRKIEVTAKREKMRKIDTTQFLA